MDRWCFEGIWKVTKLIEIFHEKSNIEKIVMMNLGQETWASLVDVLKWKKKQAACKALTRDLGKSPNNSKIASYVVESNFLIKKAEIKP